MEMDPFKPKNAVSPLKHEWVFGNEIDGCVQRVTSVLALTSPN
jgi:hypothetical protein